MGMAKENLSEKIWEQSADWIDQIGNVIGEMAKQLGVATEHVYTVYTKQIFYEGLMTLISSLLIIVLFFIVYLVAISKMKKITEAKEMEEETKYILSTVITVLFLAITLFQLGDMRDAAMKVFNPEYYTIKMIVDQIGAILK